VKSLAKYKKISSWRNTRLDKYPIGRGQFIETPTNLDKIHSDNIKNLLVPILVI